MARQAASGRRAHHRWSVEAARGEWTFPSPSADSPQQPESQLQLIVCTLRGSFDWFSRVHQRRQPRNSGLEAWIYLVKKSLPFLEAQKRRELATPLRVGLIETPKGGKDLLFTGLQVFYYKEKWIIVFAAGQPGSKPNRSRQDVGVACSCWVIGVCMVDPVVKFLTASATHTHRSTFRNRDCRVAE